MRTCLQRETDVNWLSSQVRASKAYKQAWRSYNATFPVSSILIELAKKKPKKPTRGASDQTNW